MHGEEISMVVYIVMLKTYPTHTIAKIFDSRDKAKEYIAEQKSYYSGIEWDIEAWRVF